MQTGTELLLVEDYDSAISKLSRESKRDKTDDFRIGPICDLGVAYLLTRQFSKAAEHFRQLQASAFQPVSLHLIYEGIAWWYSGEMTDSVKCWKNALKCGYNVGGSRGLDVVLILWFAHARKPQAVDWDFVRTLLEKRMKRAATTSVWNAIARYALGEIDDSAVLQRINGRVIEVNNLDLPDNLCRFHFYKGVHAAMSGQGRTFKAEMKSSAATPKLERIIFERVVARLECQ